MWALAECAWDRRRGFCATRIKSYKPTEEPVRAAFIDDAVRDGGRGDEGTVCPERPFQASELGGTGEVVDAGAGDVSARGGIYSRGILEKKGGP